jgi:hypothetical protein
MTLGTLSFGNFRFKISSTASANLICARSPRVPEWPRVARLADPKSLRDEAKGKRLPINGDTSRGFNLIAGEKAQEEATNAHSTVAIILVGGEREDIFWIRSFSAHKTGNATNS